jgi:hypothetical protein
MKDEDAAGVVRHHGTVVIPGMIGIGIGINKNMIEEGGSEIASLKEIPKLATFMMHA